MATIPQLVNTYTQVVSLVGLVEVAWLQLFVRQLVPACVSLHHLRDPSGGRSNIIPGMIVFSLFGCLGQMSYNIVSSSHRAASLNPDQVPAPSFLQRLASKKWIPMKSLSDEEYGSMLQEKLVKVEAEIALLDEDVARLKAMEKANIPESSQRETS